MPRRTGVPGREWFSWVSIDLLRNVPQNTAIPVKHAHGGGTELRETECHLRYPYRRGRGDPMDSVDAMTTAEGTSRSSRLTAHPRYLPAGAWPARSCRYTDRSVVGFSAGISKNISA